MTHGYGIIRIMITLPANVQKVINTLKDAGFEAYAVGGSVRDILMQKPTKGWDFTTNATPDQILTLFPDSFYDNQFGTVGIKIYQEPRTKNQELILEDIYEITTYRSEKGYADFRHPDKITWGKTIEEDLSRRDFTINAVAYDGTKIIDPYHGQDDIKNKTIRTVGTAAGRFSEDALRLMRAVRIAAQLGFTIEEETRNAITRHAPLLQNISYERIRDELLKILESQYPADGILLLKNTGLLHFILPELETCFTVEQKSPMRHHIYDVGTHSVMSLKNCPSGDPIVRLATLLHDIGKPRTFHKNETGLITFYNHELVSAHLVLQICKRLRLSRNDTKKIITLVRWHQFSVDERQTDSAIRRIIRRVGKENMEDMLALRIGDRLGGGARETSWRLELFKKRIIEVQKQPFSIKDLKINGDDVMTMFQCSPGPIVGEVLKKIFAEVDNGTLQNDRSTLLAKLKEFPPSLPSFPHQNNGCGHKW